MFDFNVHIDLNKRILDNNEKEKNMYDSIDDDSYSGWYKEKPKKEKIKSLKIKKEKPKIFADVCLLIKMDDLCFFTERKNFNQLIELGKRLGIEISLVKFSEKKEVLDLKDLISALNSKKSNDYEYTMVEIKLPKSDKIPPVISTPVIQEKAINKDEIIRYIKEEFIKGNLVNLAEIRTKFDIVSASIYCKIARLELEKEGHKFDNVKRGCYKIAAADIESGFNELDYIADWNHF